MSLFCKVIFLKTLGPSLGYSVVKMDHLEINVQVTPNLVLHFIASRCRYPVSAFHWDGILRPFAPSTRRSE